MSSRRYLTGLFEHCKTVREICYLERGLIAQAKRGCSDIDAAWEVRHSDQRDRDRAAKQKLKTLEHFA